MDLLWDALSWGFILSGAALILIGAAGLIRMPDFYTRLHPAGVIDTMGAELMLVGMMIQGGLSIVTIKLVLIAVFIFFTSPTSTHAVANAAYVAGLRPFVFAGEGGTESEEEAERSDS